MLYNVFIGNSIFFLEILALLCIFVCNMLSGVFVFIVSLTFPQSIYSEHKPSSQSHILAIRVRVEKNRISAKEEKIYGNKIRTF